MLGTGRMKDGRVRQVVVGFGVILGLIGLFGLLAWATGWPGFAGEFARMIAGVFTTPMLLEPAFLLLGLVVVLLLNHWRHRRDGADWVYLEQSKEGADLPEHARFAVYRKAPLPSGDPDPLVRAEGAMEIGDHATAVEALAELSPSELLTPEALALRIRLARVTGHDRLAAELEDKLANLQTPKSPVL